MVRWPGRYIRAPLQLSVRLANSTLDDVGPEEKTTRCFWVIFHRCSADDRSVATREAALPHTIHRTPPVALQCTRKTSTPKVTQLARTYTRTENHAGSRHYKTLQADPSKIPPWLSEGEMQTPPCLFALMVTKLSRGKSRKRVGRIDFYWGYHPLILPPSTCTLLHQHPLTLLSLSLGSVLL